MRRVRSLSSLLLVKYSSLFAASDHDRRISDWYRNWVHTLYVCYASRCEALLRLTFNHADVDNFGEFIVPIS